MSADNTLRFQPSLIAPSAVLDPRILWTLQKQQWQIDCVLQGSDAEGWSIRVLLNGQWFFNCCFNSWNEAIEAADEKHTELVTGGWGPIGCC
jgi:hypothetical protein